MLVVSRHNNDELFEMMQSLVPLPVIKIEGYNDWIDAATYLENILSLETDIVVNIDLDCFITNWSAVEEMVKMAKDYTHIGISDAEMKGRNNLPTVMNPFFNVFNLKKIKEMPFYGDWSLIYNQGYQIEWGEYRIQYGVPFFEPFNGLFNWLYKFGNPYFLGNEQYDDISVIAKFHGEGFAYHSWYSREFNHDTFHKERIINLYNDAKKRSLELRRS